jgi:hypothetical protein
VSVSVSVNVGHHHGHHGHHGSVGVSVHVVAPFVNIQISI